MLRKNFNQIKDEAKYSRELFKKLREYLDLVETDHKTRRQELVTALVQFKLEEQVPELWEQMKADDERLD
jgi:hypothetical protein